MRMPRFVHFGFHLEVLLLQALQGVFRVPDRLFIFGALVLQGLQRALLVLHVGFEHKIHISIALRLALNLSPQVRLVLSHGAKIV